MKLLSKSSILFLILLTAFVWSGVEALAQTCNNSAGLLSGSNDDDVGIHTQYPDKPLHIFAPVNDDCNDPAIKLSKGQPEYAGYLSLLTSANLAYYTAIQNKSIGDLVLSADAEAGDIILSTHSHTGCIRFATTHIEDGDDFERVTIIPNGQVGIFETDPKEPLQIGPRLTFHFGNYGDFIGYNEYMHVSSVRKRINDGYSSCLKFSPQGQILLGAAGTGSSGTAVSYNETGGGIRGLTVSNYDNNGCIGVGTYGAEDNRLLIRGMGSTSATNAVRVTNSSGTLTTFLIRDDGVVKIGDDIFDVTETPLLISDGEELKLSVDGVIVAREVIVTTEADRWADFVFDEDYDLLPISELDNYLSINKKLPDIPSAEEVEKNGVKLGELQGKLLQKIEELTLYVIQLKKENEGLNERLVKIESKNNEAGGK